MPERKQPERRCHVIFLFSPFFCFLVSLSSLLSLFPSQAFLPFPFPFPRLLLTPPAPDLPPSTPFSLASLSARSSTSTSQSLGTAPSSLAFSLAAARPPRSWPHVRDQVPDSASKARVRAARASRVLGAIPFRAAKRSHFVGSRAAGRGFSRGSAVCGGGRVSSTPSLVDCKGQVVRSWLICLNEGGGALCYAVSFCLSVLICLLKRNC